VGDMNARRIPREDKYFRLAFGWEPLDIFKRLGLTLEELEMPEPEIAPTSPRGLLEDNLRNSLLDVIYELSLRLRDLPGHRREDPYFPVPALGHIERMFTSDDLGNL